MTKKRIQVKKKLALLLASTLLVTSINVMPVEASADNQATGSENENAVASTDLSLSIAALNVNQGNTTQNATGSTNLSLEIASAPETDQMHTEHGSEWKDINEAVTPDSNGTYQITADGKYYLSADIQQTNNSNAVKITNNAKVTICLNGHTISTNSNIPITVDSGASLTIEDCSEPESKTGTGSVTGNGQDVIRTYGNLVVNRVNVTNTGTGNEKYAINAGGSSYDVGSVVIKNSKLKANSGSLYAVCVENITIESTECTGEFYVSKNNNMTISSSTVNEGNETAIYYTSGKGGTITITDSVLTTTSSSESDAGLMCWYSNGPITINIEGSTINAPENGIRVNNGETVKISNSKFICTNTDTPEWGYAISYEDVEEDSGNKLEVSDVEIKDWNTGIKICSDNSDNPEMNFTLSGNVKFEKKALLNTDIDFPTSGEGKVNLHFNDLTTRNMVINAYSGKMENVICDNDYSTYFIDSKYMFDSQQDGEKYVLNCTPRSITRQPTEENPQIAVNDASNVSYQWYEVESYENVVTNETIVAFDGQLGIYEGGSWKPQQYNPNDAEVPYAYYLVVKLNAGDLVILENPYGTLESMKDILDCFGSGTTEKEYKDGKLYFTIPSDGDYLIGADFVHADENWPINAGTRLKITVKGTRVTGEVAGSTTANLVTPKAGTFCCKATWAKGSAFEYSVLSDVVTVAEPIVPTETLTNIDIQVDTTKIPTLKVGDSIPDYGSQPVENSPFSFSDEVSYNINSDDMTSYGFGYYEYDDEGHYTDSEGKRLNSAPCFEMMADATTLYAYYIELNVATGYTFGDAVTVCNGNNSHFVVEDIRDGKYIRIRYDMGTLQDIEDIKNESGGTTPDPDPNPDEHTHTIVTDAAVAPSCTKAGLTEGSHCSTCGEVIKAQEKVPALGHKYGEWEIVVSPGCVDKGSRKRVCSVCEHTETEDVNPSGHSWEEDYTVDKKATCTEAGSKSIHCKSCDAVKDSTVIEGIGHTVVTDKAVAPSCIESGKTEGSHCSVCNTVIKAQEEVKALGHDYSEWTVKKASTCTEDGQKTRKCSRCDEAETQTIKAPGHTVVTDKAVEASCTEAGKTEGSHCSVCNTVIKAQEEVKALGHDYSEWTVKKAATCTEDGQKTRKCSRCDEAETQTIKAPGHTVVTDAEIAPTCTESGKTEGSHCSVCNTVIKEQKEVPAHGHDWTGEWTITKPATTTVEGKKELSCKNGCNQKKYQVISIIGTPTDPDEGKLEKDAEVSLKAPIKEATLDNSKKEILDAPAIFTETEKTAIEGGDDARVWLEVTDTDESSISSEDKTKISEAATSIMGEKPAITYFDADLFKQVGTGETTPIHEPGIEIGVTIKIPDELINTDKTYEREYKIIRLHTDVRTGESLVDILSGTFDKITGEFKFKTDKFSTYAIAYTDKKLVTGVTLTPETATLTQAGQSVQLTATVAPADATDKSVTWTSSNTKVATVDANGKVTAVANGTCTITVTTVDGSKSATSTITVKIPATESGNSGNSTDNTGNTNNNQTQNSTVTNTSDKSDKKDVISAKTGDSNAPILWTSVLLMSMTALAILFTRRKRNAR